MAKELKDLTNVVSNLYEEFETSNDIIPENVGYFSIDKRELRIGDGLTRWKDIVPFIYNEVTMEIINDWAKRTIENVPNSTIVHNRFVPLEERDASNTAHVTDLLSRVTHLEGNKAPTNHASTANTHGLSSGTKYGHSKLSDKVDDTSDISKGVAATPKAVKTAYDKGVEAKAKADAAMPISGGTFTGHVHNNYTYTSSSSSDWYNTKRTSIVKGTKPNATTWTLGYKFLDNNDVPFGGVEHGYKDNQENRINLIAYSGKTTDTSTNAQIAVGFNKDGNPFTYAPTPADNDNSTQIATTAFVNKVIKRDGVPVGTIIMYWGTTAPTGYLICNGQAITQSKYPKLYALCGANVPDLQNYFVRGATSSKPVGTTETDTGRNITGTFQARDDLASFLAMFANATGSFSVGDSGSVRGRVEATGGRRSDTYNRVSLDASRQWGSDHVASEFRPMNKRVLFCIKCDE